MRLELTGFAPARKAYSLDPEVLYGSLLVMAHGRVVVVGVPRQKEKRNNRTRLLTNNTHLRRPERPYVGELSESPKL